MSLWPILLLAAAPEPPPPPPPPLVARAPALRKGQALFAIGAGTWQRGPDGPLVAGRLDLRVGLSDRLELRLALPGLALTLLDEGSRAPAIVAYGGLAELGFTPSRGTLAYHLGALVSKRVHDRIRLGAQAELRHRAVGGEDGEIVVPGPLPSERALFVAADVVVQILPALAATAAGGYSVALGGAGRSFAFGAIGLVGTMALRADLYAQLYLEQARGDRPVDPAVQAGIVLRF